MLVVNCRNVTNFPCLFQFYVKIWSSVLVMSVLSARTSVLSVCGVPKTACPAGRQQRAWGRGCMQHSAHRWQCRGRAELCRAGALEKTLLRAPGDAAPPAGGHLGVRGVRQLPPLAPARWDTKLYICCVRPMLFIFSMESVSFVSWSKVASSGRNLTRYFLFNWFISVELLVKFCPINKFLWAVY